MGQLPAQMPVGLLVWLKMLVLMMMNHLKQLQILQRRAQARIQNQESYFLNSCFRLNRIQMQQHQWCQQSVSLQW
jgi:hypothetical protein